MHTELTPPTLGPPSANYALATLSERPTKLLHTSGIGPVLPDGSVPDAGGDDGMAAQADAVWSTLLGLLVEAELTVSDVVSVTTYVVVDQQRDPGHLSGRLGQVMGARDRALGGHRCASTLVPVPALATPSWQMEVAVVAVGS